eukprot:TRINITY_DN22123_c0_g1_i1.p1 TRINITY_DN22123_c0_g1~~TRINITY_DN22123_c0_g1_i1.p1  ORF type:complete len:191 (+),score=4.44 TRINITY_DN22123_c0_g1_i1:985-1557(+)
MLSAMNAEWRAVARSNPAGRLLSHRYSHKISSEEDLEDLREEDVWPLPSEEDSEDHPVKVSRSLIVHRTGIRPPDVSQVLTMRVPHPQQNMSPLQPRNDERPRSVPMNVPDWRKILGIDEASKLGFHEADISSSDEDEDERLPPHEFLAREYARSQIVTKSVLQGVGRTLKGRDMRRVRNAVWKSTGFLD